MINSWNNYPKTKLKPINECILTVNIDIAQDLLSFTKYKQY